jgi:hypothetical protein
MKIKLSIGKKPFSGYLNIDPVPNIPEEHGNQFKFANCSFEDLDTIINASECTDIYVEDVISHIKPGEIFKAVSNWASKLRHHGKITIVGTDLFVITKMYINGQLNTLEFNNLIYGKEDASWSFNSSQITLDEVSDLLKELGLEIISKSIEGTSFVIVGRRP